MGLSGTGNRAGWDQYGVVWDQYGVVWDRYGAANPLVWSVGHEGLGSYRVDPWLWGHGALWGSMGRCGALWGWPVHMGL